MWMNGRIEDAKDCEDCMLKDAENFLRVVNLLVYVSAFRLVREFRTPHFDLPLNFLRPLFGFAFWIGLVFASGEEYVPDIAATEKKIIRRLSIRGKIPSQTQSRSFS